MSLKIVKTITGMFTCTHFVNKNELNLISDSESPVYLNPYVAF